MIKWQNPANGDLKLKNTNVRFSFLLLWRKKTLQSLDRAKEASGFVSKSNIFHDFDFTPGSARKAPRASISSCSRRNTRRTLSKRPSGRCSIVTEIRMMIRTSPFSFSMIFRRGTRAWPWWRNWTTRSRTSRNWRCGWFICFLGRSMCIKSNFVQEEVAELRNEVGELQTQLLRHQVIPRNIKSLLEIGSWFWFLLWYLFLNMGGNGDPKIELDIDPWSCFSFKLIAWPWHPTRLIRRKWRSWARCTTPRSLRTWLWKKQLLLRRRTSTR